MAIHIYESVDLYARFCVNARLRCWLFGGFRNFVRAAYVCGLRDEFAAFSVPFASLWHLWYIPTCCSLFMGYTLPRRSPWSPPTQPHRRWVSVSNSTCSFIATLSAKVRTEPVRVFHAPLCSFSLLVLSFRCENWLCSTRFVILSMKFCPDLTSQRACGDVKQLCGAS